MPILEASRHPLSSFPTARTDFVAATTWVQRTQPKQSPTPYSRLKAVFDASEYTPVAEDALLNEQEARRDRLAAQSKPSQPTTVRGRASVKTWGLRHAHDTMANVLHVLTLSTAGGDDVAETARRVTIAVRNPNIAHDYRTFLSRRGKFNTATSSFNWFHSIQKPKSQGPVDNTVFTK